MEYFENNRKNSAWFVQGEGKREGGRSYRVDVTGGEVTFFVQHVDPIQRRYSGGDVLGLQFRSEYLLSLRIVVVNRVCVI